MNRVIKRDIEQGGGERGEKDTGGKRILGGGEYWREE